MSGRAEYAEYILEMLEPVGPVSTSRFFGGVGIASGSVQFAMVMGNSLYFVVDDSTRPKYEQAGMGPFSYTTKKGLILVRRYYELPEDVLNDPETLRLWASESKRIAAKNIKPKKASNSVRKNRHAD